MSLRVDPAVASRLVELVTQARECETPPRGWLVGPSDRKPGDLVVNGSLCRESHDDDDVRADLRRASAVLPGGLAVVGAYVSGTSSGADVYAKEVANALIGVSFLVATVDNEGTKYFQRRGDTLVALQSEPLPKNWTTREYQVFRSELEIPIGARNSARGWRQALQTAKEDTKKLVFVMELGGEDEDVASTSSSAAIAQKKKKPGRGKKGKNTSSKGGAPLLARPSTTRIVAGAGTSSDNSLVGECMEFVGGGDDGDDETETESAIRPQFVSALLRASNVGSDASRIYPAPTVTLSAQSSEISSDTSTASTARFAHCDVLAYVSRTGGCFSDVAHALRASLEKQIESLISGLDEMENSGDSSQTWRAREPRCLHFFPTQMSHPVTLVYLLPPLWPLSLSNEVVDPDFGLEKARRKYHVLCGLPADRPALRVANVAVMRSTARARPSDPPGSSVRRLRDVHSLSPGLPNSHVFPSGTAHLVRGKYDYYHYAQDGVDDAGWGCAYRSLQTICSWFRLNGYTHVPIPSHRDIQSTLVAMGDKPPAFLDSNSWIGAIELSYFLDEKYGVGSKIMTVASGLDLPQKARELAKHFDEIGTPVMMGGGQLAYTLLGVEWCEKTGECAFLILDPHYTGGEDVSAIVPRWCGWKKAQDVFVSQFYNLLMPQPPRGV